MRVNGTPIRKIYIRTTAADIRRSAALRLAQDTCLTVVSAPEQADAVLNVGIALPSPDGAGLPMADTYGPSAHPQTMGDSQKKPERSFTASCSGDKGLSGCTGSSSGTSDLTSDQIAPSIGSSGTTLDVSLATAGDVSQELWEPEAHSKQSWSDQLRIAAGCPVCPGQKFDRSRDKTYRQWIQEKCPSILTSTGTQ